MTKIRVIVTAAAILAIGAGFVLPPAALLGLAGLLALAAAGALAVMVHADRPLWAPIALVALAVVFPLEFRGPAGVMMGASLPLSAAICGAWILRSLVTRDASAFDRSRVVVSACVFLSLVLVSFAMGQFPWFPSSGAPVPAQIVELGLFSLSVCLFLMIGQQFRDPRQLRWLTWVFVATGAVTCVVQVVPALTYVGRLTTHPMSVGSVFWTFFVAVTVSQGLVNRDLHPAVRVTLLGLAALAMFHGVVQVRSWASGWVPALIAIGCITVLRWPRLVIGGGLLAVPLALLLAGDVIQAVLMEEDYSLSTRQEAWVVLLEIVKRSPMLGTGLANYYYYAENFPILGWYVPFISHNNYEDLLVQTGLLGLLAFLWFGLEALWMTFRLSLRAPAGFDAAYALGTFSGVLGSLASGMLGDWIIPFYYNGGVLGFRSSLLFWVFLGGALALRRTLAQAHHVHVPTPHLSDFAPREPAWHPSR